jgi:anhydro-N-acetylmuramic acid kinase
MATLYIGLMSGTSMDGVDAVLASFDEGAAAQVELLSHHHAPFAPALRRSLAALNIAGTNELHDAALAANALATAYAEITSVLLQSTGITRDRICAIGAHGQTVRHQPAQHDTTGYTIQLLNGARLAELSRLDVVCDFRSRDVAAGGQGAPLVPAFHQAVFGKPGRATAVVNIGGFSNLTLLGADGSVGGFDCGPGNVLLDLWCQQHRGTAYDEQGAWSAGGEVYAPLLAKMLAEPFFQKPLPKSTGRDLFNQAWLQQQLGSPWTLGRTDARNVQATLAELTARTIAQGLKQYLPDASELLVCGGGALNQDLCSRLQAQLPALTLRNTASAGIPPMQVEAAAFAWLAHRFVKRLPGNCSEVTGAAGGRILGCHYPA